MAYSGSRNISCNNLEYTLVLEALELSLAQAKRSTDPMAGFKIEAIENTIAHFTTVQEKLRRDQAAARGAIS